MYRYKLYTLICANTVIYHPPVPENDTMSIRKTLKHDKLSAEEFDNCWRACAKYRLGDIKQCTTTAEVLEKWPEYKLAQGARLVRLLKFF